KNAEKVIQYIINDLKVKYSFTHPSMIWGFGWGYRYNGGRYNVARNLKLMKNVGIPLPPTLLLTILKAGIGVVTINKLIKELGFKIEKNHVKYLIQYSVKSFKHFTKGIQYNKKKIIRIIISHGLKRHRVYCSNSAVKA